MGNAKKRNKNASRNSESPRPKSKRKIVNESQAKSPSLLSICFKTLFFVLVLLGAVAVFGYYNATFTALPIPDYAKEVKLEGIFALNRKLAKGTRKYGLIGAESIEEDQNGNLYTGLDDGRIVRIAPSSDGVVGVGKIYNITDGDISKSIKYSGPKKGRPFGLRLVQDQLYVADAYYGVYSVNIINKEVTSLVIPDEVNTLGFANDLSISNDENLIFFTDITSKDSFSTVFLNMLEGLCEGRVLQYNRKTKKTKVVYSGLCIANGIQLSSNEDFLFVSEFSRQRVRILDTKTWETKRLIELPMKPDNIRPTGKGTYWIPGGSTWSPMIEFIEKYAFLRQIIAGIFSNEFLFKSFPFNHNIVVEMKEDGEILQTLHDPDTENTKCLTQVTTLRDGRLVLGSATTDWLSFTKTKVNAIGNL